MKIIVSHRALEHRRGRDFGGNLWTDGGWRGGQSPRDFAGRRLGDRRRTDGPCPRRFDHTVPVPGLVDMAQPAFAEVGVASNRRRPSGIAARSASRARRPPWRSSRSTRRCSAPASFSTARPLGDHLPCFTPGLFDARKALRAGENEILIRVGAFREAVPRPVPVRLGL